MVLCFTTRGWGREAAFSPLSVFSKKKDRLCGFIHCGKKCFPSCSVVARASLSQALRPGAEQSPQAPFTVGAEQQGGVG